MDERKILIVNLSRGLVGEDNAALLGALLVTKVQLGAMSRADIHGSERIPFYLYVDEFQNFATDSFATILSEARKYALNLTVANQYIAQMPMEVKDAVFGNVGSIVAFRTSADDARTMLKYFEPRFEEHDLIHMHNRHFVISMTIEGEKVPAFSGISLNLPPQGDDYSGHIVDRSRAQYASSKEYVERYVHERYLDTGKKAAGDASNAAPKPAPKVEPTKSPLLRSARVAQTALAGEIAETATNPEVARAQLPRPSAEPATADGSTTKRKRRRRKKTAASVESPVTQPVAASTRVQPTEPRPPVRPPAPPTSAPEPRELTNEHTIHLK